jgi:hypothetical protein
MALPSAFSFSARVLSAAALIELDVLGTGAGSGQELASRWGRLAQELHAQYPSQTLLV